MVAERTSKLELSQIEMTKLLDELKAENETRKKTEAALRESEERFRRISSNITDISYSCIIDSNGNSAINWLYGAAEKITGYTNDELFAMKCWGKLVTDGDFPIFKRHILDILPGQSDICQLRLKKKDGSIIWVQATAECMKEQDDTGFAILYGGLVDITERKNIERSLQEQKNEFEAIFNLVPAQIWYKDTHNNIIRVNQQVCTDIGLTNNEIEGHSIEELFPSFAKQFFEDDLEVIHSGIPKYGIIEQINTSSGELRWVHTDKIPIFGENGEVTGIIAFALDITESKMAENALMESDERFQMLFNNAPLGYQSLDFDGHFIEVNQKWLETLGYSSEEVIGKWFGDFLSPDYLEGFRQRFPLFKSLGQIHSEFEMVHKNGTKLFVAFEGKIGYDLNGDFKQTHCILQDITESRRAEKALQESEQLFQGLFNASPDAIVLIDPLHPTISWPIVDANKASLQMNGYTREEMIGQSIDILNITIGEPNERNSYLNRLRQEGIIHIETFHRHKDGHVFPVEVSTSIVTIGGHEMVLGIDRDITGRKNTEERIKESEEKFRMVFENVFDGIVIYEEYPDFSQRKLIDCNKQYADMAGLTIEELLKCKNTNDIQISLEESSNNARLESLSTRNAFHGSYSWIRPDGKDNIIEFIGVPVMWHGKSYTIGMDRDITDSKKAEAELIAAKEKAEENGQELKFRNEELLSKNRFIQTILDNLPIGISLNKIDEGDVTFMNKKFQEIYGWTSDEITSVATFFEKVYPDVDYRNELIDRIMNDIQSGNPEKMHWEDIVITQKNGAQRIVNAVNIPLNEQNTMISTVVDITERKQAEVALKASEDRYRSFISQVSEGVYRFECDQPMDLNLPLEEQIDFIYDHFFIAECNDAIIKMYGLSDQKEMTGKSQIDFHGGRNNPVNREVLRKYIRNGFTIENAITEELDITGQLKYISNNSIGIIENDHLVRIWGTEIDITERVRANQVQQVLYAISNAAMSSKDLKELVEIISSQLGILLDSTNFYIAFYDEATGMLSTHFEKDEKDHIERWPAEKSITGYVVKHHKSLLVTDIDALTLCESGEIEMIGTPSKVWLGVPLFVDDKVIGAIVVQNYDNPDAYTEKDKQMLEFISHQISISIERKKAEQELNEALTRAKESDRLKSAFLANMSHEIRTPLNSIIGFSDLLLDPVFESEQKKEFAEMINASGNGLLAIINDIMDISKIEAGLVQLRKSLFSVQQLTGDIRNEYSFKVRDKGIELRLDPLNPKDEIFIESDENRLRQILVNFVGNAIKFTQNGFIEIGIRTKDNTLQIHVKDTGIGIPEEFHEKIFDRFRQVESAETRTYGGNGLGLAISKSLAELLGGEIRLESQKGIGSTFYLTIPLS